MDDVFQANEIPPMGPALAAMNAARSALTVAGGRVALAQRHAVREDADQVVKDLATVPSFLAEVAAAVDRLVAAAAACEPASMQQFFPDGGPASPH